MKELKRVKEKWRAESLSEWEDHGRVEDEEAGSKMPRDSER